MNNEIIGTNTLLLGEPGSGKTSSLASFIAAGVKHDKELKIIAILTEPGSVETLIDGMTLHAPKGMDVLPMDRLFYRYVPPASQDWSGLLKAAKQVNMMGYDDLCKIKSGVDTEKNRQFMDVMSLCVDFVDQNGESHGNIGKLTPDYMVVLDSLSGINEMARKLHVGFKPTMHQGEYGVAMEMEKSFINQLIASTPAFTCFTGHLRKDMDEVLGKPQFMPSFLGRQLAPDVPKFFSDVVLQLREGRDFKWSTIRKDYACLKARNLPLSDNLPPTFETVYDSWVERSAKANF